MNEPKTKLKFKYSNCLQFVMKMMTVATKIASNNNSTNGTIKSVMIKVVAKFSNKSQWNLTDTEQY
ncbi:hypothetical protein BLOT_016198 [Blomia tropicalis]|nr:hypothetical protein BLOT_016198 [Blomia tropicalis]